MKKEDECRFEYWCLEKGCNAALKDSKAADAHVRNLGHAGVKAVDNPDYWR